MTQESLFPTLGEARTAGELGQARAAEAAGQEWADIAFAWLSDHLRTVEYLEPDAARDGCPVPPSGEWRAFGPVVKRAIASGLIRLSGFAPRRSGHGTPGPRYRSTIYQERLG